MAKRPPLLDRSASWPMDISDAQMLWRNPYPASADEFFIGIGPDSNDEHAGYFLWANGGVEALRKNGEQMGEWADFGEFLTEEIARAEGLYDEYERRRGEARRRAAQTNSGWRKWLRWR